MSKPIVDLRERLAGIEDLRVAAGVLNWDQQTMMPRRGARARAESMATIERISHEMFIAPEIGRLLDSAAAGLNGSPTRLRRRVPGPCRPATMGEGTPRPHRARGGDGPRQLAGRGGVGRRAS